MEIITNELIEVKKKYGDERRSRIEYSGGDLSIEDIKDDTPLFGNDLGLDSIDALEIIVMLDKRFGIKIDNPEDGVRIFQTVNTIAEYIEVNNS